MYESIPIYVLAICELFLCIYVSLVYSILTIMDLDSVYNVSRYNNLLVLLSQISHR
jgi:hypothetical protein